MYLCLFLAFWRTQISDSKCPLLNVYIHQLYIAKLQIAQGLAQAYHPVQLCMLLVIFLYSAQL